MPSKADNHNQSPPVHSLQFGPSLWFQCGHCDFEPDHKITDEDRLPLYRRTRSRAATVKNLRALEKKNHPKAITWDIEVQFCDWWTRAQCKSVSGPCWGLQVSNLMFFISQWQVSWLLKPLVLCYTHLFLMGLVQYPVDHNTLNTCCHVGCHDE